MWDFFFARAPWVAACSEQITPDSPGLAGVFKLHSSQLTEMCKSLLFIALHFRSNEGSDGKVTLQFITLTIKLPRQKCIVSTDRAGMDWRGCNGDRTEHWKHVQKSQKLSIRGLTENVRTSIVGTCTCGTCASGCYCCTEEQHFRITGCVGDTYIGVYLLTLPFTLWECQLACKSLASLNTDCSKQGADSASFFSDRLQVVWNA